MILEQQADAVWRRNAGEGALSPTPGTYSDIWPSELAVAAEGIAHRDPLLAAEAVLKATEGQWATGMIPHMYFKPKKPLGRNLAFDKLLLWGRNRTLHHSDSPKHLETSGVAARPEFAASTWAIAQKLDRDDRKALVAKMAPRLIGFAEYFFTQRDFNGTGLATSVHPYETGLQGLPYWTQFMTEHPVTRKQHALARLPIAAGIGWMQPDTLSSDSKKPSPQCRPVYWRWQLSDH